MLQRNIISWRKQRYWKFKVKFFIDSKKENLTGGGRERERRELFTIERIRELKTNELEGKLY